MSDTAGLWVVAGAVVGVVGTQLTGITQAVIASRARKAEAADTEKAARAAKRRPLYENLMEATKEARVFFSDMLRVVEADQMTPPILNRYNTKAGRSLTGSTRA